jgi:hypothetical protein
LPALTFPKIKEIDVPLQKCPACGSTWFREALFYEFVPARPWLYEEEERSQEMTILICLCGQPITPPLSAGAGPRIWQTIQRLLKCLEQVQKRSDVLGQAKFVLWQAAFQRQQLQALQPQLRKVERAAARQLAQQEVAAGRRKPQGRLWQPASNVANPSGTKGRVWLESELRKSGLTVREAYAVVAVVFDAIKEGLQRDGFVETPLGEFFTKSSPQPYERQRFGLNLQCMRVAYKPDPSLVWEGGAEQ